MALARVNLVVQDQSGNLVSNAEIRVELESDLTLPNVYSDRAGTVSLGNPFIATDGADAGFHVAGGAYKITATKAGFTRIWRYVAVGLAQESDTIGSVSSTDSAVPRGVSGAYQDSGVLIDANNRMTLPTTPAYDLAATVLGVAMLISLSGASHSVAANKAFDFVRLTRDTGSNISFTVDNGGVVSGFRSSITLASGSHANAALYGGVLHATNAGPGTARGLHAAGIATGTSSGPITGVNAEVTPVATSSLGSAALQISLTSSGVDDIACGINFVSSGDRWNLGIGSTIAAVEINGAFYDAWMATGSAAAARAFRVRNDAGTEIAYWHKDGALNAISLTSPLIIGGTGVGSDLVLQSTSGVGDGTDTILFKVGNNGATTVATVNSTGLALTGVLAATRSSASGAPAGTFTVTQTTPNAGGSGASALNCVYTLSASSATNELVSGAFNLTFTNNLTGGGAWQNARIFTLTSNTNASTTIDNAVGIYFQANAQNGTVTTSYQIRNESQQGTTKWFLYDNAQVGSYLGGLSLGTTTQAAAGSLLMTSFQQMVEIAAPSAPAANGVRMYAEDNGSGKTRLMALFASGAAQQMAIQP